MSDFDHQGTAAHTRAEEERSMGPGDNRSRIPEGYCRGDGEDAPVSKSDKEFREEFLGFDDKFRCMLADDLVNEAGAVLAADTPEELTEAVKEFREEAFRLIQELKEEDDAEEEDDGMTEADMHASMWQPGQ